MPFVTGIAIYFVLWWLMLFTVLPWGIKGQHEDGKIVAGSEPGAPTKAHMKRKVIQTSIVAGLVWLAIMAILKFELISLSNIPFIPDFVPKEI